MQATTSTATPPNHQVFAIRYGSCPSTAGENFIATSRAASESMPLDYFVWLIVTPEGKPVLVDTGFDPNIARRRGSIPLRGPLEALWKLGVDPAGIGDIVLTHLHYDHAGNTRLFPNARIWLQEREMQFATGRYMCRDFFRLAYEKEVLNKMMDELFDGRISFVDGDLDLAPGISLHRIGGHTAGLQVVRVHTSAGWVVLASDLFHFYENYEGPSLFPIVFRPDEMLDGFERVQRLASDPRLLVPGHDPLVMQRFARDPRDPDFTVRLWEPL